MAVRGKQAPEVATPQVMARTLATFYAFGGVTGLLAVWGSQPDPARQWVIVGLAVAALLLAVALGWWGPRCRRGFFHLPVAAATGLIATAAWLAPDPLTAMAVAGIVAFVAVDAYFFFRPSQAVVQLVVGVGAVTAVLLLRGDIPVPTAMALDSVVIAVGVVTRTLVQRASSASRDALTGLVNRRGFDDELQQLLISAARTGGPLAVALLDVDHFKVINDTRGHAAGDLVLVQLATAWGHHLHGRSGPGRQEEAVLARHGGDEFALLLPGMTGGEALRVTQRLSELSDTAVSAGVAQYVPGETASQLMRRADAALYTAKAGGRGRCVLHGQQDALAHDLTEAIAQGGLAVHYQPLVVMETGQVFGVEALVRWTHPTRGVIPPTEFIAVAEQNGVIGDLGQYVLRTALHDVSGLRELTGRQLSLGINTSVQELADPRYAARVAGHMHAADWPAHHLVFEVSESRLETDSATVIDTLTRLLALGCSTAVDDFGTGYSSLSRLDTLPVEHLKFDTSFIATITTSPRRAQMVSSLIALARTLGLGLVAEGVETEEQAELLQQLGCRYAQGWFYGADMSITELTTDLTRPGRLATAPVTSATPMSSISANERA